MMFGVGISIIFKDKPLLALTWITLILMFVFFFIYYSGTRVIYKVEFSNEVLTFLFMLKKYKINRKIKFKKRKVGYFAMVNGRKLRFPFYTGIPSPNTKYWEKLEIEMIKNWITNLKK